jgi:hypothetical protein
MLQDGAGVLPHERWLRVDDVDVSDGTEAGVGELEPLQLQVDVCRVPLYPAEGDAPPARALPAFEDSPKIAQEKVDDARPISDREGRVGNMRDPVLEKDVLDPLLLLRQR